MHRSSLGLLQGRLQGLQRLTDILEGVLHALHLALHLLGMLLQPLLSSHGGCSQTSPTQLPLLLSLLLLWRVRLQCMLGLLCRLRALWCLRLH